MTSLSRPLVRQLYTLCSLVLVATGLLLLLGGLTQGSRAGAVAMELMLTAGLLLPSAALAKELCGDPLDERPVTRWLAAALVSHAFGTAWLLVAGIRVAVTAHRSALGYWLTIFFDPTIPDMSSDLLFVSTAALSAGVLLSGVDRLVTALGAPARRPASLRWLSLDLQLLVASLGASIVLAVSTLALLERRGVEVGLHSPEAWSLHLGWLGLHASMVTAVLAPLGLALEALSPGQPMYSTARRALMAFCALETLAYGQNLYSLTFNEAGVLLSSLFAVLAASAMATLVAVAAFTLSGRAGAPSQLAILLVVLLGGFVLWAALSALPTLSTGADAVLLGVRGRLVLLLLLGLAIARTRQLRNKGPGEESDEAEVGPGGEGARVGQVLSPN